MKNEHVEISSSLTLMRDFCSGNNVDGHEITVNANSQCIWLKILSPKDEILTINLTEKEAQSLALMLNLSRQHQLDEFDRIKG